MQFSNPDIKPYSLNCKAERIWLVADLHLDAFRAESDLITFKVFDWNSKQILEIKPRR